MPEEDAPKRRGSHHRRGDHGDRGLTDMRASTRRAGGAGGRVAAVVQVNPAFAAAIRAAAREATSEHIRAGATLAEREAASDHIRAHVRVAASELIRGEEPPP